ncbi:MAG: hypothetical protein ACE141_10885 [Bryobacteraceae bacterium]
MNPLELLNSYLERIESRFRWAALARGAALVAGAALGATLVLVLAANWYAFSDRSLTTGRVALFLCLALAAGFGLVVPVLKLNRRWTARAAERRVREFDQRLVTVAERQEEGGRQPFLELLAAETLEVARGIEPSRVVGSRALIGFLSAALGAAGALAWLIFGASGFLGHGARLLWAGPSKAEIQPFYDIVLEPGDKTVRRGSSQAVTARLVGFETPTVRLFARYQDSAKWEEAPMLPRQGSSLYEFLFAGIPQTLEYYATAGRLRSKTYKLSVVDVPGVKRLRVTYHYPAWTGLKQETEDPGGDLSAVEGTEVELAVETDRPLTTGQLVLEDGTQVALQRGQGNWTSARLMVAADGSYHVAALEQGELVRLTDDYFIEVRKDQAPLVSLTRPGRDAKVSPIEEVTVAVEGGDDFGLRELTLHYSVNGGAEKTVSMLKQNGAREAGGSTVLFLEDYKLVPGDLVSVYATASDARQSAKTDMSFIETQPFEREYTQSQQMGGGGQGMGEMGEREGQISQRQKEIISATWNQSRDSSRDRKAAAENAEFLSGMQSKLRDQAQSLSTRMSRRELSGQNQEFQSFSSDMAEAAKDMAVAAERLKAMKWQEALAPEQLALQHLLRAEATYRQIQVAFGNRGGGGGGGGGGGMQRDLESLFDLELDTEKNQYETGQQASSASSQRSREIDEALQRLEQLARRQQELAQQQRQSQQSFQQRWQQEMLRREAEELQQRMEQLARSGQQGGQSSSGQGSRSAADARLDQALRRLSEATEDMRRARSSQSSDPQQGQADSRRAAERLREAQDLMRGMRSDQASRQLEDLATRSQRLADQQREFESEVRRVFGNQPDAAGRLPAPESLRAQAEKSKRLTAERDQMLDELGRIEQQMQQAARELAGSQRAATSRLRSALGDLQQDEIATRMRYNNDLLRRGYGSYVWPREAPITRGLNQLRDQLRDAQGSLDRDSPERGSQNEALARLEQLRSRLQELTRQSGQQGQGQQGQQGQGQRGQGQQGQQGQGQQGQRGQQGNQGQGAGGQQGGGRQGGGGGLGTDGFVDGNWMDGQQGGIRAQGQNRGFDRSAMNRGDWRPAPLPSGVTPPSQDEIARVYRESMRDLSDLRRDLAGTPGAMRDIQELLAEMQRLDPSRFGGNPELLERLRGEVLPALEQIELQVRRQMEDREGGQVRNAGSEPVPPGYSGAVAEYFRRLSKSK